MHANQYGDKNEEKRREKHDASLRGAMSLPFGISVCREGGGGATDDDVMDKSCRTQVVTVTTVSGRTFD